MSDTNTTDKPVQHLNPDGLVQSRGWTHAITVTGNHKTIYIGGQDAVDAQGAVVAKGDLARQTEKIFENLRVILTAAGADLHHIVKWTIYVLQGQSPQPAVEVFQKIWGNQHQPPVITVVFVVALGNPDWLVEIDAIAIAPE
ncbi:MAG: RidA family protein [Anaerolineae bacterium]|nr:RidA family protein [Anaerolineae bacterium]